MCRSRRFRSGSGTSPSSRSPNILQRRKAAEIEYLIAEGRLRLGTLNEQAFLAAGAALYAGEGAKRDGTVHFANTDERLMTFFCSWLRRFFDIDESRLAGRVYLHQGLDIDAAIAHWSAVIGIPTAQFKKPYRAVLDHGLRTTKHEFGCGYVTYCDARTHRAIMGLIDGLLGSRIPSGVAQSAERWPVKPMVVGPSPTPGANRLFVL